MLALEGLNVWYPVRATFGRRSGDWIKAAVDVSFAVPRGSTVGLVGESGSGKSSVARAVLKLEKITSGRIRFDGIDVTGLPEPQFRPYRKRAQMIFQDPYGSLNPRWPVEAIIAEPLRIHFPNWSRNDRRERVIDLLNLVGLKPEHRRRLPHQFSGGQRQRIGIARALAVEPELLICDEPVSALDVSVQAQIVNLLQDLQEGLGLTYLFIAHDLAVVEHLSDEVVVMHRGRVVEAGPVAAVYGNPRSDYTRNLLASVPSL
ncbi:MAG: ABC transporter ATP-binding protein [Verrucomicrobia bacterium]|nr:ABC transporter ATP-binding protein [Verrucomicrobiota bacterium]